MKKIFLSLLLLSLYSCSNEQMTSLNLKVRKIKEYNPKGDVIGNIVDFQIDDNGNIYILDNSDYSIKRIDKRNNIKLIKLKAGGGPCELTNPKSFAIDDDKLIYIVDIGKNEIITIDTMNNCKGVYKTKTWLSRILVVNKTKVLTFDFPFSSKDSLVSLYSLDSVSSGVLIPQKKIMSKKWNKRAYNYTGNSGRIIRGNNGRLFICYSFPYEIREYDTNCNLVKSIKKEWTKFQEPFFETPNKVKAHSGIRDIFIIKQKYIGALVFYQENDSLKQDIHVFDIDSGNFIGNIAISKFGVKEIKYIRTNNNESVYICVEEQYPNILEFKISF